MNAYPSQQLQAATTRLAEQMHKARIVGMIAALNREDEIKKAQLLKQEQQEHAA
jgi:hypothetical protein